MQKLIKNDFFIVFLIIVLFVILLPFFFLHQGLLSVDTGREFYLSQQTALGQILYKDIFNIYGPFSYQFNAILFLLFGEKINTLYIAGIINSLIIVVSLYFIAREFLNKSFSAIISILTIFSLVFTTFLYNSNITYSYAIIYALSSFLVSLLLLIKYIKTDNINIALLSCLFAGISILNKYEFILYPLILFSVFIFCKKINIKDKIKLIISFLIVPVISFSFLFWQGMTLTELKDAFYTMGTMANSDTMKIFYSKFGNFFSPVFYLRQLIKNPVYAVIGFLPIINIILFFVSIKKIYQNKILLIFCLCSILASVKFVMYLNIEHMGAFFFPLCILTTLILCENFQISPKIKYITLLALIMLFAYNDFTSLEYKNYNLTTSKGNIYTFRKDGEPIKKIADYITKNTKADDKIIILPEGAFINFITDRKSDNFYHTLLPLYYTDTFKEEKIINHFKQNPADYFVILPLSTIEYGSNSFCDYANNFCEMIYNNYNLVQDENNIRIFKRKN